jgi:hypothetical protein
MAIDTLVKRASALGTHWPQSAIDRIAASEEYSGLGAGAAVPSVFPGTYEHLRFTIHRLEDHLAAKSPVPAKSVTFKAPGVKYVTRRR